MAVKTEQKRNQMLDGLEKYVRRRIKAGGDFSNMTLSKLAKESGVGTNTPANYFPNIYAAFAALQERYEDRGDGVHLMVRRMAEIHYERLREAPIPRDEIQRELERCDVSDLDSTRALYEKAKLGTTLNQIVAGTLLAQALLEHNDNRDPDEALKYATEAARLVNDADPQYLLAGMKALQTASHAARIASRSGDEVRLLYRIAGLKKQEHNFAMRLHLPVEAVMAEFHRSRAEALFAADSGLEIESLHDASAGLLRVHEHGEIIGPEALSNILVRMCCARTVYEDQAVADLVADTTKLLALFGPDRTSQAHKRTLDTLIRLIEDDPEYGVEIPPVDLLRVARFGAIGEYCVARYLRHLAQEYETSTTTKFEADQASSTDLIVTVLANHVGPNAQNLTAAALGYYADVEKETRSSGAAGVIKKRAAQEHSELLEMVRGETSQPIGDSPVFIDDEVLDSIAHAIDLLVMGGLVVGKIEPARLKGIREALEPIYDFLDHPIEDLATRAHVNTTH